MKIFAIDPGNIQTAYCILDNEYKLYEFNKLPNKEIMDIMLKNLDEVDVVVIEKIASYGLAVGREVFETCEWIGRFAQEAEKKCNVHYVFRKDEKLYICGDTRAKDANIRRALIDRFAKHDLKNGKGTRSNPDYFYGVRADVWASLAVGFTYLDMKKEGKI